MTNFLHESLNANSWNFSSEIENKFESYLDLLQKWNRVYNLTAIRNYDDMVQLHILDSLSINPYLRGKRIIDIGTGAGLPGIPLAIINPEKEFVLLDSNSKKTRFLIQVVHELKLQNVQIIHSRCEDYHPEKCFDTIVTRAFASLKEMLVITKHLICTQGQFLAMKGVYPEPELKDIPDDFIVLGVHALRIKGLDADRCVVCLVRGQVLTVDK